MTVAAVNLWGRRIGAVAVAGPGAPPRFRYEPEFVASGIAVAPIMMPPDRRIYRFPALLGDEAFLGLPGLLADSLPDRWGTALIDAWLAAQGRRRESFDVVERLCYIGRRGMGALEFEPALGADGDPQGDIQVAALVRLAGAALTAREDFVAELSAHPTDEAIAAILTLGTSAGGARPKAVVAYNEQTGRIRSGQVDAGPGFSHWLLKFDGVSGAGDHGLGDPTGWGALEFAYWQMARDAGIDLCEARLLSDGDRRHFMTRRFDRPPTGGKLHVQTLGALEHVSYNLPGAHSYEQAFQLLRRLELAAPAAEELYRRLVFNVIARNQDDHVKNTAFTMDRTGRWALAPAYDLTWAHAPGNRWLSAHQMSINGRRDGFTMRDLAAVAEVAGLVRGRAARIVERIRDTVSAWPRYAADAAIDEPLRTQVAASHRLQLAPE